MGKIALPILHHKDAHNWDRLSTKETKNVFSPLQVIITCIPKPNKALQELLVIIYMHLVESAVELHVSNWSILVINVVS